MTIEHNLRQQIVNLVDLIPEKELHTALKFLEFLSENNNENQQEERELTTGEYMAILNTAPYDDEEWTEDEERELQEARKEAKAGYVISLEELKEELNLSTVKTDNVICVEKVEKEPGIS